MNPLSGVRIEVGLGCGIAQGIITDPHGQVNVKHLRGDQTLAIHQPARSQLKEVKEDPWINFLRATG